MINHLRTHKKTISILFVIVLVLSAITYSVIAPNGFFSGLKNDLKTIEPKAEFPYTDLDGNIVNLNSFKGKPLIINSWASWTPFSQTELKLLGEAKIKHSDTLNILAINRMEQGAVVRSFLSTFNISQSVLFLLDQSDNFYKAISGYAMPETLFYDSEGVLIAHKRGVLTEIELNQYISALLGT